MQSKKEQTAIKRISNAEKRVEKQLESLRKQQERLLKIRERIQLAKDKLQITREKYQPFIVTQIEQVNEEEPEQTREMPTLQAIQETLDYTTELNTIQVNQEYVYEQVQEIYTIESETQIYITGYSAESGSTETSEKDYEEVYEEPKKIETVTYESIETGFDVIETIKVCKPIEKVKPVKMGLDLSEYILPESNIRVEPKPKAQTKKPEPSPQHFIDPESEEEYPKKPTHSDPELQQRMIQFQDKYGGCIRKTAGDKYEMYKQSQIKKLNGKRLTPKQLEKFQKDLKDFKIRIRRDVYNNVWEHCQENKKIQILEKQQRQKELEEKKIKIQRIQAMFPDFKKSQKGIKRFVMFKGKRYSQVDEQLIETSLDSSISEEQCRIMFNREIVTEHYIIQHINIIELLGSYELKQIDQ